ncbi:VanZ family protein [Streptomyces sp. NPDC097619]|uniref:VanZ family protein n=1 Tax=Streptomyces sp. NPDC097619 TaxID=3157228 RepID=UPI0033240905
MQQRHDVGGTAALRLRALSGLLLLAHLALVGWFTLRPLDVPWAAPANLTPLEGIRDDLAQGPLEAARRLGSALVLLAPLGVLMPLAGGRLNGSPLASLARTTATGALVSLAIEMLQSGIPGQVTDVDSLLLNTAGVALAHLAVVPAVRARLRRGARAVPVPGVESQGPTPRISRVGIAPWSEALSAVPRDY